MSAPQSERKIVLIVRPTRLDELIRRFNTRDQARFYVEHLGADFADYEAEDRQYQQAVRTSATLLAGLGRLQRLERGFVPNFLFGPRDLVVALGQDGLVANVLKYLDGQCLLGVNPDPARWEGVLLPFQVKDLRRVVPEALAGRRPVREVTMAEARLNTGERLFAVNDLFIGPRSHTSARYGIRFGGQAEEHSSSGIIVSTGLGSTGWMRSVVAGAAGIAAPRCADRAPIDTDTRTPWDADWLAFAVREPWPSTTTGAQLACGRVTRDSPLVLVSRMPEHGVIFSDGIEADFLHFNAGTEARIGPAERRGLLLG